LGSTQPPLAGRSSRPSSPQREFVTRMKTAAPKTSKGHLRPQRASGAVKRTSDPTHTCAGHQGPIPRLLIRLIALPHARSLATPPCPSRFPTTGSTSCGRRRSRSPRRANVDAGPGASAGGTGGSWTMLAYGPRVERSRGEHASEGTVTVGAGRRSGRARRRLPPWSGARLVRRRLGRTAGCTTGTASCAEMGWNGKRANDVTHSGSGTLMSTGGCLGWSSGDGCRVK
jgi:hypothetical protein